MMTSSNLERNFAISQLCKEILITNESVFFVSSLNKNGKVIESEFRNDRIITKMSKQETEMYFMQRTLQISLSKEFDDLIGPLDFIIMQRETLLELLFPYSEGILLVVCDLDVIPRFVGKKISFMLRNFELHLKSSLNAYA
jgi:hypothetical protein